MIKRFREALAAARSAALMADPEPPPPTDTMPKVLALLALDGIGPGAAELWLRHQVVAKARGARQLLILSPETAHDLSAPERLCEFLPLPADLACTTNDTPVVVERYLQTRLRLILDKWGVRECHWIGESAADLIEPWMRNDDPTLRPVTFVPAA